MYAYCLFFFLSADERIGQLVARDPDGDQIEYSVAEDGEVGSSYFQVDSLSGLVTLKKKLDREVSKHITLYKVTEYVKDKLKE